MRTRGDGLLPLPGWDDSYAWRGFVPFDDLPSELDPPRGFTVAANQDISPQSAPSDTSDTGTGGHRHGYNLGHEWLDPYRARRITQLLADGEALDREYCRAMQADTISLAGRAWIAAVLALRDRGWLAPQGQHEVQALELLARWDGAMVPESGGAAVYMLWRRALLRELYVAQVSDGTPELHSHSQMSVGGGALASSLAAGYLGQGPHPVVASANTFAFRHSRRLIERLEQAAAQERSAGVAEDTELRQALQRSFTAAVTELRQRVGEEPHRWQLAAIHRVTFSHPFGTQRIIGRLFNRGPLPVPGDNDTLFASPPEPAALYDRAAAIPSYRLIVDFAPVARPPPRSPVVSRAIPSAATTPTRSARGGALISAIHCCWSAPLSNARLAPRCGFCRSTQGQVSRPWPYSTPGSQVPSSSWLKPTRRAIARALNAASTTCPVSKTSTHLVR